jgi:energy-coupling factor transporter ATP-binding protein EcfA2
MAQIGGRPLLGTRADDKLFVNRADELAQLERSCELEVNTLVVGERGSGKSSLLNRFATQMRRERFVVTLDGAAFESVHEVLAALTARLRLGRGRTSHGFGVPKRPDVTTLELLDELVEAGARLGEEVLIVIDEFRDPVLAHTLFGRFRDELWQLPCLWTVAGNTNDRPVYLAPPADAFFDTVVELPALTPHDAQQLVRQRADRKELPDRSLAAIVEAGAGNPRRLVGLTRQAIVDRLSPERMVTMAREFTQKASAIGPTASRVFEEIETYGAASASDREMLERVGISRQRAQQVLSRLEAEGLVRASTQRGSGRPRKVFELAT